MPKRKSPFILVTTPFCAIIWGAGMMQGDIQGSGHDFSDSSWSGGEICLPCHTPHNSDLDVVRAPLWNHELTTATYTLYDGTSGVSTEDALDGRSILCMSCHDGTVALDSFGGNNGSQYLAGSANLQTDLRDDHPVGASGIYPEVPGMANPATFEGPGKYNMNLEDMKVNNITERVVACTTCHEPHNRNNYDHMLWRSNAGSSLCLTCHLMGGRALEIGGSGDRVSPIG